LVRGPDSMFTRILTDRERRHITKYLRQNGEKQVYVRKIVYEARKNLPTIRGDLELLEKLLQAYQKP
jgi:DNA primase catalytic subunit